MADYIMDEYISAIGTDVNALNITLSYERDASTRGYYLSVKPVQYEIKPGFGKSISMNILAGKRMLLLPCSRCSKSAAIRAKDVFALNVRHMVDTVCAKDHVELVEEGQNQLEKMIESCT